jgi:hypothetical protein
VDSLGDKMTWYNRQSGSYHLSVADFCPQGEKSATENIKYLAAAG